MQIFVISMCSTQWNKINYSKQKSLGKGLCDYEEGTGLAANHWSFGSNEVTAVRVVI